MLAETYEKGEILTVDEASERDTGTFSCQVIKKTGKSSSSIWILLLSFPLQITDEALRNASHVYGSRPWLRIPASVSIDIKVLVATKPKIEVLPYSLTVFRGEKVGLGYKKGAVK